MEELMTILKNLRPDIDFQANERLIDDGILDSLDIVALVSELNDSMDIDISVEHLIPENFNSIKAIWALIERLKDWE